MNRKPDIIRAIVVIFAVGLVITGFTSLQPQEKGFTPASGTLVSEYSEFSERSNTQSYRD